MNGLFGATKRDPKEKINEVKKKLRHETRLINRRINEIKRDEDKTKREIKDAAKKGHKEACVILAKGMVEARRSVNRLHMSNAHINSIMMHLDHQLAAMRMAGAIKQSTEVMAAMQRLISVPEIMQTMRLLSRELTAAGIMDEMIEETMESLEPEQLEEKAQEEVDKILWEVTAGEMGKAPAAVRDQIGAPAAKSSTSAEADALLERLQAMH